MRIGFFVWEYPPVIVGGLGTYAQNITREFIALGHDVSVFTVNPGDLKTREVMQGVEVHRPITMDISDVFPALVTEDLRRWGKHLSFFSDMFVYNILSASKFTGEVVEKGGYQFDVVCCHDWLSSIAGIMIKRKLGLPFAFHVHSTEWGRALDTGSQTVSHLEDMSGRIADRVITVSYPMAEDLIRHGWDSSKINAVWNGVDPDRYSMKNYTEEDIRALRARYGIGDDDIMIFFVGRLTMVKGVTNLVQAMPMVLSDHPKAKLVVLGSGELGGTILDIIKKYDIGSNVKTRFEFVSEDERILHYAASDIAVFPSMYEPFGIVSLEAMSMGKPILVGANGVSGFRDQVVPSGKGRTGIHVNGDNPADIAWGLDSLLSDMDEAREMGRRARERVKKYFTWEKAAERTIEIYESMVEKSDKQEDKIIIP